jgi:hypothetical protein
VAEISEFLNANPHLERTEEGRSVAAEGGITLSATVVGVTTRQVEFLHQGSRYVIDREDVLDVSEDTSSPVPPQGKNVVMRVKPDATITSQANFPVGVLTASTPFALRNPAPPITFTPTPADAAWRARVGYPLPSGRPIHPDDISFTGWNFDDFHSKGDIAAVPFRAPGSVRPLGLTSTANTNSTCPWDDGHGGHAQIYDDNMSDVVDQYE